MSHMLASAAFALLLLAGTVYQASAAEERVTTIVVIKTPAGLTREKIDAGIHASVPAYRKIPGLIRKWYTVNGESFGGMYLWENRAAAEAWFTPEYAAQCKQRYGTECQVTYFDTPLQIDGLGASQ